jgi:hypothetical protein
MVEKMTPAYVIFASGGNDSVALVDYAHVKKLKDVVVAYSNTGWASPSWPARMQKFKEYVDACGFSFVEIPSEGMENLVRRKKGFPANKPKFCTYELKILPAQIWLDTVDPEKNAICMVGVRREESVARRNWPEFVEESENHGGRSLWSPLVNLTKETRDNILAGIGWQALPHRSKECSPCVNSNRADFRVLEESDIRKVEFMELWMNRLMFRKKRFKGAIGIRQVMKWAWSARGKYEPPDDEEGAGCDSGMCGG